MKIHLIKKQQQGFAMLEVVLAVVIIAIASFGIYKLYDSSSTTSKLNDQQATISQVYSAANQLSYSLGHQPGAGELADSGVLPPSIWLPTESVPTGNTDADGKLVAPFGAMTYTGKTTYVQIDSPNIAGSVLGQFCSNLSSLGDVYVDGSAYDKTKVIAAKSAHLVTLYFPKGKKP